MPSFLSTTYHFAGQSKTAPLPEWLADSLDDRFEGDIGLIQTTRVPVHQTKVRLAAAAIDAIEDQEGRHVPLREVDSALIEHGLVLCLERHAAAWRDLCPAINTPSLAHAFELRASDPAEPAFMQCPEPSDLSPLAEADGRKLLPDFGFAVPSLVSPGDDTQLAYQLMAFAGKQFYVKGQPTGSRPLAQAIAIDVPALPAWRFQHEVDSSLRWIGFGRDQLGLEGDVVFSWLLPFLPGGMPVPRKHQHPLLLDVGSPIRLKPDGRVAVYSQTCTLGGSDMQLGNAALGPREAWPASGLPGLRITPGSGRKTTRNTKAGQKHGKAEALAAAGLEAKPEFVQRPFGKVPGSADILALIETAKINASDEGLGTPVLDIADREEGFDLPEGAELVIEGEPIGASTTSTWLDVRVPLPDPMAGADSPHARWRSWQAAVDRQLKARDKSGKRLSAATHKAFLLRHGGGEREPGKAAKDKAGAFASRWKQQLELSTEGELWLVAAASWNDLQANTKAWNAVLARAEAETAQAAFAALGGFDDAATVLAAGRSGLLWLIERREREPA